METMHTPPTDIIFDGNILASFSSFGSAMLLQISEPVLFSWDIPPVAIHWLQVIALSISIVTGSISLYKWAKKKK